MIIEGEKSWLKSWLERIPETIKAAGKEPITRVATGEE